jgi:hypothetical protein
MPAIGAQGWVLATVIAVVLIVLAVVATAVVQSRRRSARQPTAGPLAPEPLATPDGRVEPAGRLVQSGPPLSTPTLEPAGGATALQPVGSATTMQPVGGVATPESADRPESEGGKTPSEVASTEARPESVVSGPASRPTDGEARAPWPDGGGADSALAALDSGRFVTSLPEQGGTGRQPGRPVEPPPADTAPPSIGTEQPAESERPAQPEPDREAGQAATGQAEPATGQAGQAATGQAEPATGQAGPATSPESPPPAEPARPRKAPPDAPSRKPKPADAKATGPSSGKAGRS